MDSHNNNRQFQRHSLSHAPTAAAAVDDGALLRQQQQQQLARLREIRRGNSESDARQRFVRSGVQLPSTALEGQTWMDFLRDDPNHGTSAGPAGPNTFMHGSQMPGLSAAQRAPYSTATGLQRVHSDSTDRKRRLTAPESPDRRGGPARLPPYRYSRPSGSTSTSPATIDLTSSPPQAHTSDATVYSSMTVDPRTLGRLTMPERVSASRVAGDMAVPSWQPDSEVSKCPVCDTQFSFWYRKHHCRKCGRVVCASCSPHRITLPRQFIVQPPSPTAGGSSNFVDLTEDFSGFDEYLNNLGGGEEVRVCNPCVPDPNLSPPPQQGLQQSPSTSLSSFPQFRGQLRDHTLPQTMGHGGSSASLQSTDMPAFSGSQSRPAYPSSRTDPNVAHPSRLSYSGARPQATHSATGGTYPNSLPHVSHGFAHTSQSRYSQPLPRLPVSSQQARDHAYFRQSYNVNAPLPPTPACPEPPAAPMRRQIAEEDECPVCGSELPPKGPDGSEADREAHVMECISSSFAPSSSTPANRASMPHPRTAVDAAVAASAITPAQAIGAHPQSLPAASSTVLGRERAESSAGARRNTVGRMLRYQATEKDCVGDDGEPQECVICFEEFEESDEMGRLACLCKFHLACIRKWWETKGAGSCPTHQLHD